MILACILGIDFSQSIAKQSFEANARHALEQALGTYPGVHLADLRFQQSGDQETVTAVLRTPITFSPEQVTALEAKLPTQKGTHTALHIRSVITKETTRSGYLNEFSPPQTTDDKDKIGQ